MHQFWKWGHFYKGCEAATQKNVFVAPVIETCGFSTDFYDALSTMFHVKLNFPKSKKSKGKELKQFLPVPISNLTDIKANDSIWRFYHGKIEENRVKICDQQEAKYVNDLGFFGNFGGERTKTKKKGKDFNVSESRWFKLRFFAAEKSSLVRLEEFDFDK